ncbi:MAG: hypothetical protein JST30_14845 [Armatimonadetes bacterium]|nr:hypothetical protein [Armatimonadota bacterium]
MTLRFRSFVLFAVLAGTVPAFAQTKTYIALGDSVGWGYQPDDTSRGPGDKGYVRPVADWIGTQQGGVRPVVINLSVPGEDSDSFFDTSEIGALLNSNYPVLFRKSQADLFKSKVASELGKGHVITHVTYAMGANDLLELLSSQFLALPFEQQQALADQALATVRSNVGSQFALIRQQCPTAKIVVPGYYNPYGAFPGSPEDRIGRYAIPKLNVILQSLAKRANARFATDYPLFVGQELALTWIGEDDVHPRDAGYGLIATQVIARFAVPLDHVGPVGR